MFCKNKSLRSQFESLITKRKAGKAQLVSGFLFTMLLCIANSYTYAQSGGTDSAVVDYKSDTSHFFTVTRNGNIGKVGIGTGAPQVQLHTTGPVRFAKYKNNSLLDSVLATDVNGNLILVPKPAGFDWNNTFTGYRMVKFQNENDPYQAYLTWDRVFEISTRDTASTGVAQYMSLSSANKTFLLKTTNVNRSLYIIGDAYSSTPTLDLQASRDSKVTGIRIDPDKIRLIGFNNNAAGDSVLSIDVAGNLKLKYISTPPPQAQEDSSWAWADSNIYNKNSGFVGIGTQNPTAKLHANGTVRFESYRNNLQGDSVLTTDTDGNLKFVYMPYGSGGGGGTSYSFRNGIIQGNGNVSLGGQLEDSVAINLSGYNFSINNGADKVWHMSGDGNVGIGARADAGYKMNVYGDVNIGHRYDSLGNCEKLSFGVSSNSDPLYFQRANLSANSTDLRLNIGDDGGSGDRFVMGYTPWPTTTFTPTFVMEAGGRMAIGSDQVTGELTVGRDHGIKLSVGNDQWPQSAIIRTAYDNTQGDYTDILVPGAAANSSLIRLNQAGNVGIGTFVPDPAYKLSVNGKIRAKGLRVQSAGWSDFVFEPDYKLLSLPEVEKFIKEHKHLPEIPSSQEVMTQGQEVGEIQSKLLQKIEELTLYTIELNKQVKTLEEKNKKLEAQQQQIGQLQQQLEELKKLISK